MRRFPGLIALALAAGCAQQWPSPAVSPERAPAAARVPAYAAIYRFNDVDGGEPSAAVIADAAGSLYGTTLHGGIHACVDGCGTAFKLTASRTGFTLQVLHRFAGGADGEGPSAGLVAAANGSLFGTTTGSSANAGTVFELTPVANGYRQRILHAFSGADGAQPYGVLLADADGTLYGTTGFGGGASCKCGTVFRLTPAGSAYSLQTLTRFSGGRDGANPETGLVSVRGVFYGTTDAGGNSACGSTGCGTIFSLTKSGSGYVRRVVYRFRGGRDGAEPTSLSLSRGGALIGTTAHGGGGPGCNEGCGTIFELQPSSGTVRVLYAFDAGISGAEPSGAIVEGRNGTLFGTTDTGGPGPCGCGTVFALTPRGSAYSLRVLHAFAGRKFGADGAFAEAGLTAAGGRLYGTTYSGGLKSKCGAIVPDREFPGCGTVFSIAR
jgi:uncharacterized repeat protein (TIGR03803 family)